MDNKQIFANNLKIYMALKNKERKDVCEDLGFNYYTFCDWVNAKKTPRMDKVQKLADYFGILKSDLIEYHEEPKPLYYVGTLEGEMGKNANLLEMNMKFLKLNEQAQEAVIQMINALYNGRDD